MEFFINMFVTVVYQPFFNLLVGIYWLLNQMNVAGYTDMGIAVVIFTIALRLIMLPLSIRASRTEKERFEIEEKVKAVRAQHQSSPIEQKQAMKAVFKDNPVILFSEGFNLFIQIAIALMLWRIFATGLGGTDVHLLYSFMPNVPEPYNLRFLGEYDLTHPHASLNLLQSLVIFILEALHLITSPFPVTRKDVIRLQIALPVVSFIIFSQLPAGKKLFVITTLCFSIVFTLGRHLYHVLNKALKKSEEPEVVLATIASEEKVE